jgi:hypothetical protein
MSEKLLAGRFRLRRRLGEGGAGIVYEADDAQRDERVALKRVRLSYEGALRALEREFRPLAEVQHPNLVRLHEVFAEEDPPFFTMELVEGADFVTWARAGAPRDARALHEALGQLVRGVGAIRRAGKLHRDLKPSNVIVTPEGRVVILDFGLVASVLPEEQPSDHGLTGTPVYMSPEQVRGTQLTEASDWYAVGVVLYEALTGRPPFDGAAMQVVVEKQRREPAPPGSLVAGVAPELDALCVRLLRRDPEDRPLEHEILSALGLAPDDARSAADQRRQLSRPTQEARFVGREGELHALRGAARDARLGAVVVLLSGPTGVGKTRLVEELLAGLGDDALVLRGRCHEGAVASYAALEGPLDDLAKALHRLPRADLEPLLPAGLAAAARPFPAIARLARDARGAAPPHAGAQIEPIQARRRAARALRELLHRVAQRRPVALFLDELHLGDLDSAAVLGDLLRPPDAPPLLVLATHAASTAEASPLAALDGISASYGSDFDVRRLELAALGVDDARTLAERAALGEPSSEDDQADDAARAGAAGTPRPSRAERIAALSAGNPLAIELLVLTPSFPSAFPSAFPNAAAATAELFLAQLAACSADARALIDVLAVAARPLAQPIASEAAGLDAKRETAALSELRARGLIRLRRQGEVREIECRHEELRELTASRLAPDALVGLHRALARALEGAAGRTQHAAIARHARAADDLDLVAAHAPAAADEALEAFAFDRAARLLDDALFASLTPEPASAHANEQARALRVRLGAALAAAGHGERAAAILLESASSALAADALDHQRRAADLLIGSGRLREGVDVLARVVAAIGGRLVLTTWLVLLLYVLEQLRLRARGLGYRRVDLSRRSAEELKRIDLWFSAGVSLAAVHPTAARIYQARHLRLALDAGDEGRIALGLALNANTAALSPGDGRGRAERLLSRLVPIAARLRDPHVDGWIEATRGMVSYLEGSWQEAARRFDRAHCLFRDNLVGSAWELASVRMFGAFSLFHLGELAELWRRLPTYEHEAREVGDRYMLTNVRIGLANARWLARDDVRSATAELDAAMADWGSADAPLQRYYELVARVNVDLYAGRGAAALQRIDAAWRELQRSFLLRLERVGIEARHLRARAALAAFGQTRDAALSSRAERDVQFLLRHPRAWARALGEQLAGAMFAAHGDRTGAIAVLGTAAELLEEQSMRVWAATATRRRGELLGAAEGGALVRAADALLNAEGIRNPSRWSAMFVPFAAPPR